MEKIKFICPTAIDLDHLSRNFSYSIASSHFTNFGPNERRLRALLEDLLGYPVATACNAGVALDLLASIYPAKSLPAFTFPATNTPVAHKAVIKILPATRGPRIGRSTSDWVVVPFGDPTLGLATEATVVDAAAAASPSMLVVKEWLAKGAKAVVVSLHATKIWPAGEGSFVAFQDTTSRDVFSQATNWGIKIESDGNRVCVGGTNAKMSELAASCALASYQNFQKEYEERTSFVEKLSSLATSRGLAFIPSFQSFWVAPQQHWTKTVSYLESLGIESRNYYWDTVFTPEKELTSRGVCIPTWVKDSDSQNRILRAINELP
jgi:dTDP-4-amino-4,6-dideoxygalactose transaminase